MLGRGVSHYQQLAQFHTVRLLGACWTLDSVAQLQHGFDFVVDAGQALYAFSSPRYNKDSSFQVMSWAPTADANPRYPSEEIWAWRSLPGPPPPHEHYPYEIITSYAVHPDGHTVFMTTSYRDRPGLQKSTYSFNTKHCFWRRHAWTLPFQGLGHFDNELNAWVGLDKDGYVRACQVASDSGSATPMNLGLMQLDWQKLENKLFHKDRESGWLCAPYDHVWAQIQSQGRAKNNKYPVHTLLSRV